MKNTYFKSEKNIQHIKNAGKKGTDVLKLKCELRKIAYYKEPKLCPVCKGPIVYKKRNENIYCSSKCRANQIHPTVGKQRTDLTRKKISLSMGGDGILKPKRKNNKKIPKTDEEKKMKTNDLLSLRLKTYYKNNPDAKLKISKEHKGKPISIKTREKIKTKAKERVINGTHIGWAKRNKPSYPELFFMEVLKNNKIDYEFEKKVGKYFIDFAIKEKMIALEIDGKQHLQNERIIKDKEKDEFLLQTGWHVYRILWKNINSVLGKQYIKNEIDKFISFLYNK